MPGDCCGLSGRREVRPQNVVILAAALAGCGRTSLDGQGVGGMWSGSQGSTGSSAGAAGSLCDPAGIRVCHDPECPVIPGECPPLGCTPAANLETGAPEQAGVCWLDIPTFLSEPCIACNDGEVCVHRSPTELICVPFAVCDSLAKLGAPTVCRYADKSPFTDAPPASGPCPPGQSGILCDGGCGPCNDSPPLHLFRCVGRSATRPHGLCVETASGTPNLGFRCSYAPDGSPIQACPTKLGELCAVFSVGPPDDIVAQSFGICVPGTECVAAATAMPLRCLDANGSNQAM